MKKNTFCYILMAFMAMSFFSPSSYAQSLKPRSSFKSKIKTPNTKEELKDDSPAATEVSFEEKEPVNNRGAVNTSPSVRQLRQHGLGFGLGQTFLLGNYSDHGDDKITFDLLYSYAASYSFDLLINAHMSEHENENEAMKIMGLSTSIKGRLVEYDNFSPYFLAGLGFYAPKAKREENGTREWSNQKVTFGLNFGGGIDLRLNENYVVGVLGQLHWPFAVQQDKQSDLKGYYFKLLLTGMYLF